MSILSITCPKGHTQEEYEARLVNLRIATNGYPYSEALYWDEEEWLKDHPDKTSIWD